MLGSTSRTSTRSAARSSSRAREPGDTLEVELLEFRPQGWGWTAIIPGFGLLADEFPDPWLRISRVEPERRASASRSSVTLPYRPFPGTLGVAPAEPGPHSIVPPSRCGGNMDTKHLNPGATLYLPVGVEGALFSLGDTHAAQGDGEVCGTAIETAMDVVVRLSVRRDFARRRAAVRPAGWPRGRARAVELPRLHRRRPRPDGGDARRRPRHDRLPRRAPRPDREEAYAVASVACDLRIHEVVDAPNWVVGCFVPESIFEGG